MKSVLGTLADILGTLKTIQAPGNWDWDWGEWHMPILAYKVKGTWDTSHFFLHHHHSPQITYPLDSIKLPYLTSLPYYYYYFT